MDGTHVWPVSVATLHATFQSFASFFRQFLLRHVNESSMFTLQFWSGFLKIKILQKNYLKSLLRVTSNYANYYLSQLENIIEISTSRYSNETR